MLAIIDKPWTREMLSSALAELNPTNVLDLYRAFPLMLALLESADGHSREMALSWEIFYDRKALARGKQRFSSKINGARRGVLDAVSP